MSLVTLNPQQTVDTLALAVVTRLGYTPLALELFTHVPELFPRGDTPAPVSESLYIAIQLQDYLTTHGFVLTRQSDI